MSVLSNASRTRPRLAVRAASAVATGTMSASVNVMNWMRREFWACGGGGVPVVVVASAAPSRREPTSVS